MDPSGTVLSRVANYRAGRIIWVGDRGEVQLRCWGARGVADTLRRLTGTS